MEHLLFLSKCSIFHNIFKYVIFQRRQKALMWSKGLSRIEYSSVKDLAVVVLFLLIKQLLTNVVVWYFSFAFKF